MIVHAWLESFAVFAEHLNFTHAARTLHITQPALHVQIRKLSESLGVALYRRSGRSLVLTAEGVQLLHFARDLTERSQSFLSTLTDGITNQPVVLAAGEGAFLYVLGPAIRAFRKGHNPPLRLLTRNAEQTIDAVRTGAAHVGVASLAESQAGLRVELLAEFDQVVVMPKAHPLAVKKTVGLRDLSGEPMIVAAEGRPHRMRLAKAMFEVGAPLDVAVEANGWPLMLHFAQLGLGLAVVNACCKVPAGLVARRIPALGRVAYHVVRRAETPFNSAVPRLLDALANAAG